MKNLTHITATIVFAALFSITIAKADGPQDEFFNHVRALCGLAVQGKPVIYPENDPWLGQEIILHVRTCMENEIHMPLHLGENHSRVLILTRTASGIRLEHDHRHEDGKPDDITFYGGDTTRPGSATRQSFPVNQKSKDMFQKHGRMTSLENTWTIDIEPGKRLGYRLTRPGLDFKIDFDLTTPVSLPPDPWGHAGKQE